MKNKYILLIILGFWLLAELAGANQLALVKLTPEQRIEAAQINLLVYQDFQDALLVGLNDELMQTLKNKDWKFEIIDSELSPGEYYLVYKAGKGKYHIPGRVLLDYPRYALIRISESDALKAKATGYEMKRLMPHPIQNTEMVKPFSIPERDTLVQQMVEAVSLDSLIQTERHLQDYQTRYTYTRKCDTAAWFLHDRFQALGLSTEYDVYLAGASRDTSYNVIATLPGQVQPESIVIVCGHFDSYSDVPYTLAPGADDNGTGTAAVLEAARILSKYQFRWTIMFIGFSGEEQWMLGSYHWVDSVAVPEHLKIGGVYNMDMFAYTAYDSNLMYVIRNLQSTPLAIMAESVNVRFNIGLELINYRDDDCAGDNTPFWEQGIKAVFALEDSEWGIWNGSNPYYHTTQDTIGNLRLGQLLRGTQLAVGCLAAMAKPTGINATSEKSFFNNSLQNLSIFPNPFAKYAIIPEHENESFLVYDIAGKLLGKTFGKRIGSGLAPGVYFLRAVQGNSTPVRIIKID
jgi:hypothetical protein